MARRPPLSIHSDGVIGRHSGVGSALAVGVRAELAIRTGGHRNLPTAWLFCRTRIPPRIATWVTKLASFH